MGLGGSCPCIAAGHFLPVVRLRHQILAPSRAATAVVLSRGLHLVLGSKSSNLVSATPHSLSPRRPTRSGVLVRVTRVLSAGLDSLSQQQSLPRHPLRGGAGSPAREPAQAPEVSAGLRGRAVLGAWGDEGRWLTCYFL